MSAVTTIHADTLEAAISEAAKQTGAILATCSLKGYGQFTLEAGGITRTFEWRL